MKKKKGFTLVELLGVIAILALIVAVAAPPIVNQIKKSRSTFDKATLSLIYTAADSYVDNKQNDYPNINENTYCVTLDTLIKSGELKESIINIDKESEIAVNQIVKIAVNNDLYNYSLVEANKCTEYSKPTAPELSNGMIPIVYNGTNWIKADINNEWYDYNSQEWANAVLVTAATRVAYQNALAGTTINEADVLAYLVWIPRYRYKLFNVGATLVTSQTIEIMFEDKWHSKSNGSINGSWLTHPAFTFGNSEANGIWVGKFETTGDATTPTIKPNIGSLTGQNTNAQFTTSQKFSNTTAYGLSAINDSHMMKNIEWGAVAYLSQSDYGKYGNPTYTGGTGLEKEIYINNINTNLTTGFLGTITGCAGNTVSADMVRSSSCPVGNQYQTTQGVKASTTGNIYGIYDMSGGSWEQTMGVMYNSDNLTLMTLSSGISQATLDSTTMNRYLDKYIYGTTYNNQLDYDRRHLGDATGEVRSWNSDYDAFVEATSSWFIRGGAYNNTTDAGVFNFNRLMGGGAGEFAFRVVILGE
ncbi:MAG: competence type IV pilus major pilin ComGC [Ignavibacteriales bacterium]